MIGWVDASGELVRVSAPNEPVPECNGLEAVDVPAGFLAGAAEWDVAARAFRTVDRLADAKAARRASVCNRAEALRNQFLTPGSGQAITYTRKEAEARAWAAGDAPASAPFLAAEAAAVGMTIDALALVVIAQADAWVAIGSAIEARRRGLLVAIEAAATAEELEAVDIDAGWPTPAP